MIKILYDNDKALQMGAELAKAGLKAMFDLPEDVADEVAGEIAPMFESETETAIVNNIDRMLGREDVIVSQSNGEAFADEIIELTSGGGYAYRKVSSDKKTMTFENFYWAVSELSPAGAIDDVIMDADGELIFKTNGNEYIIRTAKSPDEKIDYFNKMN